MLIKIHKNRSVSSSGTWGTKNENNYEILDFEFPEELEEYNKRIVYYLGSQKVWDPIIDNKVILTNAITTKESVKAYIWCTKTDAQYETDVDFRTQLFEMNFFENENADGIVPTEEQIDGFNTMLTAMNEKIEEIDELETTIKNAETQRQENEETRQNNEKTRQENEQTRQNQEAERERRTDKAIEDIKDKTTEYNQNAQEKTESFNTNASQKTNDFNSNYTQKVNEFNSNVSSKTNDFNSNAETKTNAFNTNATNKTNDFNSNATEKTTTFDNNATEKTNEFNTNTQNKINEYDEHIADYQAQIDELQEEVEELSENMPWNETEQATEIDITDAAKYSKNKMKVFGNTEQTQYSGKNLLDDSLLPITAYGLTISKDANENIVINGTPNYQEGYKSFTIGRRKTIDAGTYTMSIANKKVGLGINVGGFDGYINITMADTVTSKTNTSNATYTIQGIINIRYDAGTFNNYIFNPMLELSSTATDYEPYTNGPSPNPDYPQDIHVVSGENTIEVQGENLIFNNLTNQTINGVTFVVNPDKSVTINGTASATTQINLLTNTTGEVDEITLPAGTYTLQGCPTGGSSATYKLDITNNGSAVITDYGNNVYSRTFTDNFVFDRVRIVIQNGTTVNNLTFKPMLVKGNTNVPYVPYVEPQNYPINLGSIELCKIGDYQDYLYKDNGNWYKYGAIGKVICDGTENWNMPNSSSYPHLFQVNDVDLDFVNQDNNAISNYFIWRISLSEMDGFRLLVSSNRKYLRINHLGITSVANFKTWLSTHNTDIYYQVTTPTRTQITDETLIAQLDAIYEHLKLVKGTNNITVTATDLAPYMELSYMQDLPAKLDNLDSRLALLE